MMIGRLPGRSCGLLESCLLRSCPSSPSETAPMSGGREKIAARESHCWSSTIDDRLRKPESITCQCQKRGTVIEHGLNEIAHPKAMPRTFSGSFRLLLLSALNREGRKSVTRSSLQAALTRLPRLYLCSDRRGSGAARRCCPRGPTPVRPSRIPVQCRAGWRPERWRRRHPPTLCVLRPHTGQ